MPDQPLPDRRLPDRRLPSALHTERRGHGPTLVLVHGFTQSASAWGPAGDLLAAHHTTLAFDAPGHGRSAGVAAGLETGADLMADTVTALGVVRPAWLGYSMGGRFALHVAVRRPDVVARLVLVSTTAGIDDTRDRAERRRSDESLADRVTSEGLEHFVRWWIAQPIFATLAPGAAQLDGRLEGTAEGLASSLRLSGTGTQEPLWDRLGEMTMPVLVVAGELDTKYCNLAERLVTSIGANATLRVIAGAGHACHLERPDAFAEAVQNWLDPAGGDVGG